MNNPYRIHSSIGFGFLQLLLLTSLSYPAPPPKIYQNVALVRLGTSVYFSMYQKNPFYLKLDCASIVLKIICDALYVRYIITNYTYLFGIFDIFSDILFFVFVNLSLRNDDTWDKISEKIEEVYRTCFKCCCGWETTTMNGRSGTGDGDVETGAYPYTSLPSEGTAAAAAHEPIYTFGGRQAFKPGFYSSSWGREYLNNQVDREFDTINRGSNDATITGADGTEYIRFDESSAGASHYANLFVSPYFTKDGTPITLLSNRRPCNIGILLLTYNLLQFIYQLMMYSNIMVTCGEYTRGLYSDDAAANATTMIRLLC
jgi:hypothetical protein